MEVSGNAVTMLWEANSWQGHRSSSSVHTICIGQDADRRRQIPITVVEVMPVHG